VNDSTQTQIDKLTERVARLEGHDRKLAYQRQLPSLLDNITERLVRLENGGRLPGVVDPTPPPAAAPELEEAAKWGTVCSVYIDEGLEAAIREARAQGLGLASPAKSRDPHRLYRDGDHDGQISIVCQECGSQEYWDLENGELHLSPQEMGCSCAVPADRVVCKVPEVTMDMLDVAIAKDRQERTMVIRTLPDDLFDLAEVRRIAQRIVDAYWTAPAGAEGEK